MNHAVTPEELAAIKYRHRRGADILGEVCWTCSNTETRVLWPCATAVALAEVDRLQGVEVALVKLSRAIDRAFADPERPGGRPQDTKLDSDALALSEEV